MNKPILPDRPFALGTTSFIYPDHILPNVKKLGLVFDEIELLVFESSPREVLPSKKEVETLLALSRDLDVTYNIHLPTDVSLTCDTMKGRQKAVDTLLRVMALFTPLKPTTHTLHLEMPRDLKPVRGSQRQQRIWLENTRQSLGRLVAETGDPGILSIETLDYPFSLVEGLVAEFNLSVCIDAGHQIKYDYDLVKTFDTHQSRTAIIHLHGVDFSGETVKDHTSLDMLPEKYTHQVQAILGAFTGVVSLEVFNLENLNRSLESLAKMFKDIPLPIS